MNLEPRFLITVLKFDQTIQRKIFTVQITPLYSVLYLVASVS